MHCHLLVSDLVWPHGADACRGLDLPALERAFARGELTRAAPCAIEEWLCRAFGVQRQLDWPIAPLTLAFDGGTPAEAFWLRADPVHLRIERTALVLADAGTFTVSADEAAGLAELLDRHWRPLGMALLPLHPTRWYARLPAAAEVETCLLAQTAGRNVHACLPGGAQAMTWQRALLEAQMLLHDHALNQAREARGELAVNSVWFWGGGVMPRVEARAFEGVCANDVTARALATAARIDSRPLPRSFDAWLEGASGAGEHLIVLDALRPAAQYADVERWRDGMLRLEADWFAPALRTLAAKRFELLRISVLDADRAFEIELRPAALRKWWRRARPLTHYATAG